MTNVSDKERLCEKLSKWVYSEMKVRRMTQKDLAREMGISQQALSMKLKLNRFIYDDFLAFVKIFQPSQDTLVWLIT